MACGDPRGWIDDAGKFHAFDSSDAEYYTLNPLNIVPQKSLNELSVQIIEKKLNKNELISFMKSENYFPDRIDYTYLKSNIFFVYKNNNTYLYIYFDTESESFIECRLCNLN